MNATPPTEPQVSGVPGAESYTGFVAGQLAAKPLELGEQDGTGGITTAFPAALAYLRPEGARVEVVDLLDTLGKHRDHPTRKTGTYKVHDAASFISYLQTHVTVDETEVWADALGKRVVGVLNSHQNVNSPVGDAGSVAGWGDHRVTYDVAFTDAWKVWAEFDRKLMSQSDFAELIEMRMVDVVKPTAADMLELAQTFEATIGVRFESSKILSSGERQLTYKENVEAGAGRTGQLEIPKEFELALTPFEGAEPYRVTARFRFRIGDGNLRLGYVLVRPEDVLRDAFKDVVDAIRTGVPEDVPVFLGVTG